MSKESTCNAVEAGDVDLITGSGRSPGRGHGNSLRYSCLENPTDRGVWQAPVHRVAVSWTHAFKDLFPGSLFFSIVLYVCLYACADHFGYCSFVVCFEMWKYKSSDFVLHFHDFSADSGCLEISNEF